MSMTPVDIEKNRIEPDHAELNEGVMSYPCHDYFQD